MSTYPNTLESILGPNIESILAELEEIHPPITPNPDETMEKIIEDNLPSVEEALSDLKLAWNNSLESQKKFNDLLKEFIS